jgi:sugar phosphate isomerase/epimerase
MCAHNEKAQNVFSLCLCERFFFKETTMKIAFTTLACPDWSFEKITDTAHALGYGGIEIRVLNGTLDILNSPELAPAARETTLARLRENNLVISALGSSVRFIHADAAKFDANVRDGKAFIDRAQMFGAPFIRVYGDPFVPEVPHAKSMDMVVDGMRQLGQYAKGTGVTVLIESHQDFAQSHLLKEVMQRVDLPEVGVLYDTHHPWRFYGERPQHTVKEIGSWIRYSHWKDSKLRAGDGQAFDYVLFGEGEFPIADALNALKTIHYDGWYAFEWEKKWHPEIAEPEVALPHFMQAWQRLAAQAGIAR